MISNHFFTEQWFYDLITAVRADGSPSAPGEKLMPGHTFSLCFLPEEGNLFYHTIKESCESYEILSRSDLNYYRVQMETAKSQLSDCHTALLPYETAALVQGLLDSNQRQSLTLFQKLTTLFATKPPPRETVQQLISHLHSLSQSMVAISPPYQELLEKVILLKSTSHCSSELLSAIQSFEEAKRRYPQPDKFSLVEALQTQRALFTQLKESLRTYLSARYTYFLQHHLLTLFHRPDFWIFITDQVLLSLSSQLAQRHSRYTTLETEAVETLEELVSSCESLVLHFNRLEEDVSPKTELQLLCEQERRQAHIPSQVSLDFPSHASTPYRSPEVLVSHRRRAYAVSIMERFREIEQGLVHSALTSQQLADLFEKTQQLQRAFQEFQTYFSHQVNPSSLTSVFEYLFCRWIPDHFSRLWKSRSPYARYRIPHSLAQKAALDFRHKNQALFQQQVGLLQAMTSRLEAAGRQQKLTFDDVLWDCYEQLETQGISVFKALKYSEILPRHTLTAELAQQFYLFVTKFAKQYRHSEEVQGLLKRVNQTPLFRKPAAFQGFSYQNSDARRLAFQPDLWLCLNTTQSFLQKSSLYSRAQIETLYENLLQVQEHLQSLLRLSSSFSCLSREFRALRKYCVTTLALQLSEIEGFIQKRFNSEVQDQLRQKVAELIHHIEQAPGENPMTEVNTQLPLEPSEPLITYKRQLLSTVPHQLLTLFKEALLELSQRWLQQGSEPDLYEKLLSMQQKTLQQFNDPELANCFTKALHQVRIKQQIFSLLNPFHLHTLSLPETETCFITLLNQLPKSSHYSWQPEWEQQLRLLHHHQQTMLKSENATPIPYYSTLLKLSYQFLSKEMDEDTTQLPEPVSLSLYEEHQEFFDTAQVIRLELSTVVQEILPDPALLDPIIALRRRFEEKGIIQVAEFWKHYHTKSLVLSDQQLGLLGQKPSNGNTVPMVGDPELTERILSICANYTLIALTENAIRQGPFQGHKLVQRKGRIWKALEEMMAQHFPLTHPAHLDLAEALQPFLPNLTIPDCSPEPTLPGKGSSATRPSVSLGPRPSAPSSGFFSRLFSKNPRKSSQPAEASAFVKTSKSP